MSSYRRKCKHCGRTIQMRQMPHGQWVAFEGYDTPHDCSKPVPKGNYQKTKPPVAAPPSTKMKSGDYNSLEFPNISIPGQASQSRDGRSAEVAGKVDSFPSSQQEIIGHKGAKQGYVVQKKTKSIPSGFWWIIFWLGIILLLVLIG